MSQGPKPPLQPQVILDFLSRTLPFSELDIETRAGLIRSVTMDFQPKGTRLWTRNESLVDGLHIVQQGGVRLFLINEEGVETNVDYRGEGATLGAMALFRDGRPSVNVETVEDTFFLVLRKETFLALVERHPSISRFFLKSFSHEYVDKAFADMRQRQNLFESDGTMHLFSSRVGELARRAPVTLPRGTSIRRTAAVMVEESTGSVLITEGDGDILGIVTDKDLRKAVSLGMDYEAPVEIIMSSPVETIEDQALCFDALLRMMSRQMHHLAVLREGRIVGVVTSHDIVVHQGRSPIALFREISSQREIEGLYPLSAKIPYVISSLVEEGAKAGNIARMITVLNDLILDKVLTLLQGKLGIPPAPFCWLLMGSEGRREQTFKTDQDNALVYKDVQDDIIQRAIDIYFTAFAEQAIEHLIKCGFPRCPGEIMASNPKWRQPFAVWRDYFERWILVPEPREILHAAIFFDFRAGFGQASFADELRRHVSRHASKEDVFLRHLAANCLQTRPPISFFRNFIVEKDGEHRNTLDIKERGLAPVVDFARVLALKHDVLETSTLSRLEGLGKAGCVPRDLNTEIMESYEFMMQVRLVHQLQRHEQGLEPNNRINPATLSDLDKKTLKEAFGVIGGMQSHLKEAFRLNIA